MLLYIYLILIIIIILSLYTYDDKYKNIDCEEFKNVILNK